MSTETNTGIIDDIHPLTDELRATVHREVQASKAHALQAAGELKSAVEAKGRELLHVADDTAHEVKARAEKAYEDARTKLKELQGETEQYVRQNPLTSVCIALGAGFVLGMLARR